MQQIWDMGLIHRLGRFLGGGRPGNPLQYSCLENPTGRGAWQITVHGSQSWTRPSDFTSLSLSSLLEPMLLQKIFMWSTNMGERNKVSKIIPFNLSSYWHLHIHLYLYRVSLVAQSVKESACNTGDWGLIPGSQRSQEEGNGNPL